MLTITDETIEERRLVVDGISFERCRLIRSQLFYGAKEPTQFKDCIIEQCTWVFEDAAENMFALLSSLYRNTTGEGQQLIDAIFAGVRDGTLTTEVKEKTIPVPA